KPVNSSAGKWFRVSRKENTYVAAAQQLLGHCQIVRIGEALTGLSILLSNLPFLKRVLSPSPRFTPSFCPVAQDPVFGRCPAASSPNSYWPWRAHGACLQTRPLWR